MDRKIYTVYGNRAKEMAMALLERANVAYEIPDGAKIALKPNLVVGEAPEGGATTHGGILEGAIEYLQAHGHTDISIIEGAWVGDRTERGFAACGYRGIGKRYNVPLYDLKRDATVRVNTPVGPMQVCKRALEADYLISLPVLKGHCQTLMTCALKNSKGCIPDAEKRRFHSLGLHRPIAALATVLKPALFIVDSICGDLNFEEGGTPVQTNRMLLGHDPVQIDAYGCQLMGIDPRDVEYIGLAEKWGVGSTEIAPEDLIFVNSPADAPDYPKPQGLVRSLTKNVRQNNACSACFGNLVRALYQMQEEGVPCRAGICIGQGFAGTEIEGVGIGKCCRDAKICVPGCPPDAKAIRTVLEEL